MNAENFKVKYTRLATLHDTQAIVDLAIKLGLTTTYKDMPVNRKKVQDTVENLIIGTPKEYLMMVSVDENDQVIGFIAGIPFEVVWSTESLAIEIGWYVQAGVPDEKKRYLELRAGYEEWARRKGFRYAQYAKLNPTEKDFRDLNKNEKSQILELVYHRKVEE